MITEDQGASVPSAGEWAVIRSWGISIREIAKVTPKLLKLGGGSQKYPTQIGREDRSIVCLVPSRAIAEKILSGLAGVDGEYSRRKRAADKDYQERINAALDARTKALARLIAQAMSAEGQDPQGLGAQPASAVPQECAQGVSS